MPALLFTITERALPFQSTGVRITVSFTGCGLNQKMTLISTNMASKDCLELPYVEPKTPFQGVTRASEAFIPTIFSVEHALLSWKTGARAVRGLAEDVLLQP